MRRRRTHKSEWLRRRLTDHSEHRRRIRFRATLPVRIHTNQGEIQGETRNVSLLGVSAIATTAAPQGAAATAEIDLPRGGPPIRMEGTIIRSIPLNLPGDTRHEVGFFALSYQNRDEKRLSAYLKHLQLVEFAAIKAGYKAMQAKIRAREAKKRALLLARRRRLARRLARRRRAKLRRLKLAAARRAKAAARCRRAAQKRK